MSQAGASPLKTHAGCISNLRLSISDDTRLDGKTCIRRRDLADSEARFGPLMRSGFRFEGKK